MNPDTIPPELRQFVEQELATGRYQSAEEVIADGLRLLRGRKLHELRKDLDAGLQQLERGEGIELEDERSLREFFDAVKAEGRERMEAGRKGK